MLTPREVGLERRHIDVADCGGDRRDWGSGVRKRFRYSLRRTFLLNGELTKPIDESAHKDTSRSRPARLANSAIRGCQVLDPDDVLSYAAESSISTRRVVRRHS